MANQRFIRTSILLTSLLAAVSLTACGDDNDDNSSATSSSSSTSSTSSSKSSSSASTSSTSSSTSSTSSSTSSTSSSTSSTAGHTSVTATTWSETFDAADVDAFLTAGYAALPSDATKALYLMPDSVSKPTVSGGSLVLGNSRFLIGAATNTPSTSSTLPDGIFNIEGKTCSMVVTVGAIGGSDTSKLFQVYVNNSTSALASSPLGNASRPVSKALNTLSVGDNSFAIGPLTGTGGKAFLQLRVENGGQLTIDKVSFSCN